MRAVAALSRPVAAICAATLALAHAGLLDNRLHTTNGKDFIEKHVSQYHLAPFAFAAEIFRALVPDREDDIKFYESLYSRGLMDS